MIIFGIVLVIIAILAVCVAIRLIIKLNSESKLKNRESVEEILSSRGFDTDSLFFSSKRLIIALNKKFNKIAVIEDFNPNLPDMYHYSEIKATSIINIETNGFLIKLNFRMNGAVNTLEFASISKEAKEFCHNLFKKILFRKLESKYPDFKFNYFASSDWSCSYIWAYDSVKSGFAYLFSGDNQNHQILNLRKEFFTIDTDYNYLELPIMGEMNQLLMYEKDFLNNIFQGIYNTIYTHVTPALIGKIFYDNYNNILYLTNGTSKMQSILIDRIEEVFYRENRLQFTLLNNKKVINYITDREFIEEFEKFVVGYNLRKIANSFDYKSDKLINVNLDTKFIFDITRDRIVYCANLNKFYGFSYMTIAFFNLKSAEVIKNSARCYVRIKTKDDETLDVTCLKYEVAQYIKAQIDIITSDKI